VSRTAQLPPGPRGPALIQTVIWAQNAMRVFDRCRARYGPTFTLKLLVPGPTVFVSSPAPAKIALAADPSVFTSGEANLMMKPVLGPHSVVVLDGQDHLSQRRHLLHALHADHVNRHRAVIEEVAEREVAGWPVGETFPIHPRMESLTFQVIMRTVFGTEDGPRLVAFRDMFLRVMSLTAAKPAFALLMASTPNWGRYSPTYRRSSREIDAFVHAEVARRRADPRIEEREDMLSQLLVASNGIESSEELRDHLMTFLIAGYETTATALAWTFERALRHPDVWASLQDAADGDDDAYLEAVIKETLRVRTLVPVVFRKVNVPVYEIDGHELPKGTLVGVSPHLMHTLPELYPDPAEFRPERFLGPRPPDTYTWIPFGGGVRRCAGASFSMFEMKTVLRSVLRHVSLSAPEREGEGSKRLGIIYRPARGARVTVDAFRRRPAPPREPAAARDAGGVA
jgi:cytochrome P450 family 135